LNSVGSVCIAAEHYCTAGMVLGVLF